MGGRLFISVLIISIVISACRFYFKTTSDTIKINPETNALIRGKNLTFSICAGCHYNKTLNRFTGKYLNDLPKIGGRLVSSNLTHSKRFGMPDSYTDAELFYLLKTGISKSGKFMPYMMKPMMADQDVDDIISYLRSNDVPLQSLDSSEGKTHINLIGKTGIRFLMKPQPYLKGVKRVNEDEPIQYGRYLVAIIGCYHCHSRKITGLNFLDAEKTKGYLQGGIRLKDPKGKRIFGSNLTMETETGIGNYSQEEFSNAVRNGINPSGRKLSPPMDHFDALTDKQVNAIYAYLKSIPPVHHYVKTRS